MKTRVLIIALFAVFIISSCHKCPKIIVELTSGDYSLIPYKLGQSISFIDADGQIFEMIITKEEIRLTAPGTTICDPLFEWLYVSMHSDFPLFDIQLNIFANRLSNSSILIDGFKMLSSKGLFGASYSLSLEFDNDRNFICSGNDCVSNCQKTHNSLEINNQTFIDVVEKNIDYVERDEDGQVSGQYTFTIFYNRTYGILQVLDKGKVLFTINH